MTKMPTTRDSSGSTTGKSAYALPLSNPLAEYVIDATQRTILFWDVLRQRSKDNYEHKARGSR